MTTLQTSEVLDLSADAIQSRGWIQSKGWNAVGGGPVCLEGGIMAALGMTWQNTDLPDSDEEFAELSACPAYVAVKEYLGDVLGEHYSLFNWNDMSVRTAEEVVEVLRSAAAVERVKESALAPALACPA
jgi:hypothetical protein